MSGRKAANTLIVIIVLLTLGAGLYIYFDLELLTGETDKISEGIVDTPYDEMGADEAAFTAEPKMLYHPADPAPGDFMVVEAGPLENADAVELDYDFDGTVEHIYRAQNHLYAIIGIGFEVEAGSYNLGLTGSAAPAADNLHTAVTIAEKDFTLSYFTMPADRTAGWTADRLAEDRERIRQAREVSKPYPLWMQSFIAPLEGPVTSEFGAVRVINNNPPRRHNGIDYGMEEGTPIVAPNRGIVRLADSLLSGGNTVIIEHGIGISSTYMHLHEIAVEEGDIIDRGELIGTVGMTGYATGPHLHWEVNVGQTPVNPEQLINNDLLWIAPAHTLR